MPEAFTNSGVRLTTTGVTTIYQAPTAANSRAVVLSSLAANASGVSSVNYSVDLTDSADTVVATIAKTIAVPANATLELIPNLRGPGRGGWCTELEVCARRRALQTVFAFDWHDNVSALSHVVDRPSGIAAPRGVDWAAMPRTILPSSWAIRGCC